MAARPESGARGLDRRARSRRRRVVVTHKPNVEPLENSGPDEVSDATLGELCPQVPRLHEAGISHGRLNLSNVLVDRRGPMLVGL